MSQDVTATLEVGGEEVIRALMPRWRVLCDEVRSAPFYRPEWIAAYVHAFEPKSEIVLATAIVNFPLYARIARAESNVLRNAGFVHAARLCGNGELRILLGQVLPNIMPIMVVQMSLTMGYAILNAAGLSFIGLGVRPPTPEWGIMVAEGAAFMVSGEWWIAFFPGAALMLAVFCFNLLGDGLRDIVDPRRRT